MPPATARTKTVTWKSLAAGLVVVSLGGAALVLAQGSTEHTMLMQGVQNAAPSAEAGASPSTTGSQAAMETMRRDTPPRTGNTDLDQALNMIPHHQAAIDMARVEVQHGKDVGMRKLATETIAAQAREISELKAFPARQPQG